MKPTPGFKPGDPPPAGYLAWHNWADVQSKAGLIQRRCRRCGLWNFPQELATPNADRPICLQCQEKET